MFGPSIPISQEIHTQKYRQEGETFQHAMFRVAKGLSDDSGFAEHFYDAILGMRFLPAGRVQSAIGAEKRVTPYNCYVSGTIEDSFVNGDGSIMQRAHEAAATMRMGGGIGYDFSTLRPRGDLIKGLNSQASGPLSFMEIFDAVCKCVASSGHRRGAQMGVLRIDHPDIELFIDAKQDQTTLRGFNLSIGVTDKFFDCLQSGTPFPLEFEGHIHKWVDAAELWDKVMRTTWDWAEPGVLFIDTINRMNNLWYCETIAATNPCGEQPLPPFGACLLGSFNLVKYVHMGPKGHLEFDFSLLRGDIAPVVRAMDNVTEAALYPLPAQEKEARSKRRMGLGVTGLANAAEALGYPYGSRKFCEFETAVLSMIRDYSYAASSDLAAEKGSFPLYDERYLQGRFFKSLDRGVQEMIRTHGVRNSHLTSIAPTGTISLAADNVSSSIEPVFSHFYNRTITTFDGPRVERVEDYGMRHFGVLGKTSSEVTASEHVKVLTTAAVHVDSAVSKTCNVSPTMDWTDFKQIYLDAYDGGAKGCTTFNSGGKRFGVLVATSSNGPAADESPELNDLPGSTCEIDLATGRKSCE